MSRTRFWVLLLHICIVATQDAVPVRRPTCTNPQGVYVAREGLPVEVCFSLPHADENYPLPLRLNVATQNRTTLGTLATSAADYVNSSFSVVTSDILRDQDIPMICRTIQIHSDDVVERTEYFTVSLRRLGGFVYDSCEVAIFDGNGGPTSCYDTALTGASIRQSQVMNDTKFCFTGIYNNPQIQQCRIDSSFAFADCTQWSQNTLTSLTAANVGFTQLLPNILAAGESCVEMVKDALESMYRTRTGDVNLPPPRRECSTNCVLTVRNDKTCEASVLLLQEVQHGEALGFLRNLTDLSPGVCQIGLQCCDLSRQLPSTCGESPPTMVPAADASSDDRVVIIGSVVGAILGLILVGGAVVTIVVLLVACLVYLSRRKEKTSTVESSTAITQSIVYKRKPGDAESIGSMSGMVDTPLFNPIYDNNNPPDYELVVSTELSISKTQAKWKKKFSGMIISATNLRYGELIGEGAFGKVYQGILKTPPAHGARFTTQRDVAVKTLKKASKTEEVEDFIVESAVTLDFNHPNILRLVGVCFDTQDKLPAIVLPYMANRDLRSFLKSRRSKREMSKTIPEGLSEAILLGMCMDIACGMAYLAKCKFVHRDLAARNCMVDGKLSVKVADFGLSRDVYLSDYYRLTHRQRLPIKWMPPESIFDSFYTEKSDVWAYGTVCWEVFMLGKKPYSDMENADIPDYISEGNRLSQPQLCPNKLYELMMKTWREEPDQRPTFNDIVEQLSEITGNKPDNHSDEHTYLSVDELTKSANHGSDEEDVGGIHVYTELESPVYKNFQSRSDALVCSLVPEEYEVPIPMHGELVVPIEYEVPVSSLPRLADKSLSAMNSISSTTSSNGTQQLQESGQGHIYHTLEPPGRK